MSRIPRWLHGLEVAMIDTETTGLDPVFDRVVEVAVVVGRFDPLRSEEPQIVRSWSTLVFPEKPIPPELTLIHGIGNDDVFGQPRFVEVASKLVEVVGTALPAAFNARFDRQMIGAEMIRAFAEKPTAAPPAWCGFEARWLDVYTWGRKFQRFQPGKKKLPDVARRLGIVAPPGLHRAEVDAALALGCLWKLAADERFPDTSRADALAYQYAMGVVEHGDLLMHLYKKGVLSK